MWSSKTWQNWFLGTANNSIKFPLYFIVLSSTEMAIFLGNFEKKNEFRNILHQIYFICWCLDPFLVPLVWYYSRYLHHHVFSIFFFSILNIDLPSWPLLFTTSLISKMLHCVKGKGAHVAVFVSNFRPCLYHNALFGVLLAIYGLTLTPPNTTRSYTK